MRQKRTTTHGGRTSNPLAWLASFPEENPYPVIEIDTAGTVTYLNPAARRQFPGLVDASKEHPIIKSTLEGAARLRDGKENVMVHEVRLGEAIYEQQISMVRAGKRIRSYLTDVTGRKHLERHAQHQASELARKTKTLEAANVKLKEMGVLKDDFVAKASHELRTPLTSIKEGLSLLLDNALGETTEEQRDFIKTMDGDIDRLTELINNMLDLSKIEAGRMRLLRRRLALRGLIDSLIRSYQPLIGQRTVRAEAGEVPMVFADANRILQILSNLFSNAMKFTKDDGRIIFRLGRRGEYVSVEVEDNGPGISAGEMGKLFQKFTQVGVEAEGARRGTGLGLVVCKELSELHGGRIEAASEVGRGTRFTVFLPVYTDTFALTESFRELLGFASSEEDKSVALIAVEARGCLRTGLSATESVEELDRIAEQLRQHVHRGDVVLAIAPSWVVVLALTDETGCRAVMNRLRRALGGGEKLQFGAAVYPVHGRDVGTLFDHASKTLNDGLARPDGSGASVRMKGRQP